MDVVGTKTGWMAAKSPETRRYHFIRETMAVCGGLGFYTGDLVPDAGGPKGNDDCAKCFRVLRGQQQAAKLAGVSK